ncbi:MAG: hypothetical protein ABFD69_15980 [Candidatus Sumerlaeia bacterium]
MVVLFRAFRVCIEFPLLKGLPVNLVHQLLLPARPEELVGISMARGPEVTRRLKRVIARIDNSPLTRRAIALFILISCISVTTLAGLRVVHAGEANLPPAKTINPADVPPGARVLHFPADRSLGRISINARHYGNPYYMYKGDWGYWDEYEWEFLAHARGDIIIPPGKLVRLDINAPTVFQDLSALEKLGPNDIHHLFISDGSGFEAPKWPSGFNPDNIMPHLAGLTRLKVLNLRYTSVTAKGLAVLPRLTSLERLTTPLFHTTSNGLAIIGRMKTLKGLYDITGPQKSRVKIDCTPLSKLTNLEELSISGVAAEGMRELESLPNLKWLQTSGEFNDAIMTSISRIPNLKLLDIGGNPYVNLKILAQSPSIEELDLHWNERVTDNDIANLRGMRSLKSIDLWHAPLTDRGAEYLSEISTLEAIDLNQSSPFTDNAFIALSRLPRLRHLSAGPMTARSLEALAKRADTMEELFVFKPNLDDNALAEIGKLTHLKRLTMHLGSATNAGLAHLKGLTQLETCEISSESDSVGLAGISQLGSLGNMRRFMVHYVIQDNSVLDISGMKNLEVLHFYLKPNQSLHDADLACLAGLNKLQWLQLGGGDELTDRGLTHLTGLESLNTRLMVGSNQFTDTGMKSLVGMQRLRELVITGRIGDAGLAELAKLKGLIRLEVSTSAQVSPSGMESVRRIPMLNVSNQDSTNVNKLPAVGQEMKDFKIQMLNGEYTPLSKLADNKVIMLHLWASYDKAAIAEIPRLRQVNQLMNNKFPGRFALMSVSINEEEGLWRDFVTREKMEWTQGRSRGAAYAFGIKTTPAYFLLNKDGKVLLNPESSWKNIDEVIARELKR